MISKGSKLLVAVVFVAATQAVCAAERVNFERMMACADESDDARRLACYDREIARVRPQTRAVEPAAAEAAPPPVAAAATPAAADDSFGIEGSDLARQRKSEEKQTKPEVRSLTAKITEISKRPRGELVVTLDNGHVWAQKKPDAYLPVKVGDVVTISAGALGSYRLVVSSGRSTQVTRVK